MPEKTMYEDELPADISDADYSKWFEQSSVVDGVRMGPKIGMDKDEIARLNRVGAEICDEMLVEIYGVFYLKDDLITNQNPFSPATDLNHNAMVMEHFDNWIVGKQKSEFRKGKIYTCTIWIFPTKYFIGQADTEALARARAYEKAWELEKGK